MQEVLWDVVVIGAGMSGLGAGLRLALAGKKVLIVEQHNAIGGLNSFYLKDGIKYDVGLHALTNYVKAGTKGHPLTKLCRQLRIPYEALQLSEQKSSLIQFPELILKFTNDFNVLLAQIEDKFPKEREGFQKLIHAIDTTAETELTGPAFVSTREVLKQFIQDPLLQEMLLLPLFYYGSAHVNDLDWRQFVILFKAIYQEGFARPKGGVRTLLKLLRDRYREWGGTLRVKTEVAAILTKDNRAESLLLKSGEVVRAHQIISSIGYCETLNLCGVSQNYAAPLLSFAETITTFEQLPQAYGWENTIVFFNQSDKAHYCPTQEFMDLKSGVICIPENYCEEQAIARTTLRTTHLASYPAWKQLDQEAYRKQKQVSLEQSQQCAFRLLGGIKPTSCTAQDSFTPLTIERFTKHFNGAIYGFPEKRRLGTFGYKNLYLCGTDQGFLGIVGALLSGISIANLHCLK